MSKLKFIFSWLWDFLKPTIQLLLTSAGKVLLESAKNAVVTAEATNLSGSEKYKIAKRLIEKDLKAAGYTVGAQVSLSLINTAIELMVDKFANK